MATRTNIKKRIWNRLWLELKPPTMFSHPSILSILWGCRDLRSLFRQGEYKRFMDQSLVNFESACMYEDMGVRFSYCFARLQLNHDEDPGDLLQIQDRMRQVARRFLESSKDDQSPINTAGAVTLSNYATLLGLSDEIHDAFELVDAMDREGMTFHVPTLVLKHIITNVLSDSGSTPTIRKRIPLLAESFYKRGCDTRDNDLLALGVRLAIHAAHVGEIPDAPAVKPFLDLQIFRQFAESRDESGSVVDRLSPCIQQAICDLQHTPGRKKVRGHEEPPLRVLVVSDNWIFLRSGVEALENDGCTIRTLDFGIIKNAFHDAAKTDPEAGRINQHIYSCNNEPFSPGEVLDSLEEICPLAHALLNWCDVVICEWWNDYAAWMSRFLPPEATLIIRCHSVEVFVDTIYLTNMRRIDGLIFIAPHIKNIFESVVGERLLPPAGSSVIPNFRTLPSLEFSDRSEATQFTLGMTQYASRNKDPMFALQILEILRAKDTRWRIRFLGHPWPSGSMPVEEADCRDRFLARVDELGDAVVLDEYTHDINAWYAEIGFILSCSHREGSHESLLEGMLTGAVPVLREWPMVKPFGAPQCVYPDLPTFVDVESGADCIEAANQDFAERSQSARNYALNMVEGDDSTQRFVEYVRQCHETRFMDTARATAD